MNQQSVSQRIVYWHLELPPRDAEVCGDGVVEATSARVPGTLAHRDELWERCLVDLMTQARSRLEQEVVRQGGDYAHVLSEAIVPRRNDATGQAWLHGTFGYTWFREATRQPPGIERQSGRP